MEKVLARIIIEGRLQGMNFRYHAQQQAEKLGLVGFVRNLADGRIEIEAQGNKDKVEALLEWCQQEPYDSNIRSILYRFDEPTKGYTEFMMR